MPLAFMRRPLETLRVCQATYEAKSKLNSERISGWEANIGGVDQWFGRKQDWIQDARDGRHRKDVNETETFLNFQ